MIETIQLCKSLNIDEMKEDLWFALCWEQLRKDREDFRINVAPMEKAKTFSVESVYDEQPFGVHKIWVNMAERQVSLHPFVSFNEEDEQGTYLHLDSMLAAGGARLVLS